MRISSRLKACFDHKVRFMAHLAGLLIIFMMFLTGFEVVMRYFFNRPIFWADEVCAYGLLYVTFLGAALVLKDEGHVKVDILLAYLNPRAQARVNFLTSIVGAVVCLVITWYGAMSTWEHFLLGYNIPTLLSPPKALILVIIPLGTLMLFIQFLLKIYEWLKKWSTEVGNRE